ncbi:thioredoxin family protein [Spirosoma rigui]|uniref:thioredoxin family protein n=1 Tax=Spirosoma rigui TaxID=564064 RepID=UPI0009B1886C|nr:thioredoxin family protein [Spirosoma rigui]
MEGRSAMKRDDPHPILIPARSAVLLIFTSTARTDRLQQTLLADMTASLQTLIGHSVRILKIDEAAHPEVVQSFGITQVPSFVLVRQGIELWRQVGMPDKDTTGQLTQQLLGM